MACSSDSVSEEPPQMRELPSSSWGRPPPWVRCSDQEGPPSCRPCQPSTYPHKEKEDHVRAALREAPQSSREPIRQESAPPEPPPHSLLSHTIGPIQATKGVGKRRNPWSGGRGIQKKKKKKKKKKREELLSNSMIE